MIQEKAAAGLTEWQVKFDNPSGQYLNGEK